MRRIRALFNDGKFLQWSHPDWTDPQSLEVILNDMLERIERLEGAWIGGQLEIRLPERD